MIGGTSGSEAKLFQPSRSQSKITQTRSSSLGSRNTSAPFEPCCLRFSAPLVEKTFVKRSKSSTVVVARSILSSLRFRCLGATPRLERVCAGGDPATSGNCPIRRSRTGATVYGTDHRERRDQG